jgi:hypothetical protein
MISMSMEYNVECDKAICATEKGMTSPLYWAPVVYMDRSTYNDRVSLGNCAKAGIYTPKLTRDFKGTLAGVWTPKAMHISTGRGGFQLTPRPMWSISSISEVALTSSIQLRSNVSPGRAHMTLISFPSLAMSHCNSTAVITICSILAQVYRSENQRNAFI